MGFFFALNYSMKNKFYLFSLILSLLSFQSIFAQGHLISGTIVDENGTSLPGVTVVEENTTNGVVSDLDGKYVLDIKFK